MGRIIKKTIRHGDKPTAAQAKEVERAARIAPVFDEDSPEFSYEELAEMARVAQARRNDNKKELVTLRVSAAALRKAKATGKGYTGFLGRLVENALDDKELVARSL